MIIADLLRAYFQLPFIIPALHGILTVAGVRAWMAHSAHSRELSLAQSDPVKKLAQRVCDLGRLGVADAVAQERHAVEETLAAYEDRIRAMANAILLLGVCATLVGVFKATNEKSAATAIADTLKLVAEPFAYTAIGALWAVLLLWLQSSASKLRATAVAALCHAIDEAWAEGYREYQASSHQGMAAAMVPVMEGLANGLAGFQSDAFDDFGATIGGLGDVVTSLGATLTSAQASAQNQTQSTATTADAVKRLADVLEQMRGVEANYAKIADLGQTFKNDMGGARRAFEDVAGSTAMLVKESAASFQESMNQVHSQLLSVAGQLAAVEQYAAGTRDMAERLDTVGERFDRLFTDYTVARQEHANLMASVAADAIGAATAASADTMRQAIAGIAAQRGGAQRTDQGIIAAIEQMSDRQGQSSRRAMLTTVIVVALCGVGVGAAFMAKTPARERQVTSDGRDGSVDTLKPAAPTAAPAEPPVAAPVQVAQAPQEASKWQTDLSICSNLARSVVTCLSTCAAPRRGCLPEVDLPVTATVTDGPIAFAAAAALLPASGAGSKAKVEPMDSARERVFRACLYGLSQLRTPGQDKTAAKVEACVGLGAGAVRQQGSP